MTQYEVFWTRLPEECKLNMFLERMESELNARKINLVSSRRYIKSKHSGLHTSLPAS
jgi:hypothetical protein